MPRLTTIGPDQELSLILRFLKQIRLQHTMPVFVLLLEIEVPITPIINEIGVKISVPFVGSLGIGLGIALKTRMVNQELIMLRTIIKRVKLPKVRRTGNTNLLLLVPTPRFAIKEQISNGVRNVVAGPVHTTLKLMVSPFRERLFRRHKLRFEPR